MIYVYLRPCSFQMMANHSDSPIDEMQFIMKNIKEITEHYKISGLINNEEIRSVNSALSRILQDILSQKEINNLQRPMETGGDTDYGDQ